MQFKICGVRPVVSRAEVNILSLIAVLLLVPILRRVDLVGAILLMRWLAGVPQVVLRVEWNADDFAVLTFIDSKTG